MKYVVILLVAALALASCNVVNTKRVKGNGKVVTKNYDFKNFKAVDVGGNINVFLKQGDSYSVKMEADENLFSYVKLKVVDDGVLVNDTKGNYNLDATGDIKLYITVPAIDRLSISGASIIATEGKFSQDKKLIIEVSGASSANISLRVPELEMESTGASTLTIDGETKNIKAEAVGASTINAFNLKSENAEVSSTGASTIRAFSSVSLKAEASGASSVKYKGNPKVTADASGASSVNKEE